MLEKRKILFVDDDPQILSGLKRCLSPMREEWQMSFVSNGMEALKTLSQAEYDVIVSDMRMPEMDGAALLEEVRTRYPHMARLGLSGQSDQEMILRAIGPTHQYLSKPCNTDQLKCSVARTCALRELLGNEALLRIISGMTYIPSMPILLGELRREMNSPNGSLDTVARIIASDVSMTAKILQLVNSEFFGLAQKISNPEQAVNYLGLETIRALILGLDLFSGLSLHSQVFQVVTDLWNHSLVVGVCARQIAYAERVDKEIADEFFTAGLLHDIGEIVIALNFPEQRKEILTVAREKRVPHWRVEKEILGATHMEVGAYLLGLWGLPDNIVEAVAYHHMPMECVIRKFAPLAAVAVADCLHNTECGSLTENTHELELDIEYLKLLDLADHVDNWKLLCQVTLEERLGEELERLVLT